MTEPPAVASAVVGRFDPARAFPPGDPLTVPLLRLTLATGDVRRARMLFVMTNQQVNQTTGLQQMFHGGQLWYAFRLLCSHLKEGGDVLKTLTNSVADRRLSDLLRGRPAAIEALGRLRLAFGKGTFITKVRDSIGFHYQQSDIKRVFEHDLAAGRVDGAVVACEVGGLSWFTITEVLAVRLLDEAAGADLAAEGIQFAEHGAEATLLADDLCTFVDHLVDALLQQHPVSVTQDTSEIPALLQAARDAEQKARAEGPT